MVELFQIIITFIKIFLLVLLLHLNLEVEIQLQKQHILETNRQVLFLTLIDKQVEHKLSMLTLTDVLMVQLDHIL